MRELGSVHRNSHETRSHLLGAVVVVALGLIIVSALVYPIVSASKKSSISSTSTDIHQGSQQIPKLVNRFAVDLGARNATALVGFYSDNSKVSWAGVTEPFQGTYESADGGISRLYQSFTAHATSPIITTISNLTTTYSSDGSFSSTFKLAINYTDAVGGPTAATIDLHQNWIYSGGTWLIQNERWDYLSWSSVGLPGG